MVIDQLTFTLFMCFFSCEQFVYNSSTLRKVEIGLIVEGKPSSLRAEISISIAMVSHNLPNLKHKCYAMKK